MLLAESGSSLWASTLLSPPILFFVLGVVAAAVRSDLKIPKAFSNILSLYLLFAIGFKGGAKLHESGFTGEGLMAMLAAGVLSAVTPVWMFFILRGRLGGATAAGVAATYGSVSAVTFAAAGAMLGDLGERFGGHMVAAMVIMEFPALIVGVLLARAFADGREAAHSPAGAAPPEHDEDDARRPRAAGGGGHRGLGHALAEACTNGSIVLLIGSLVIGAATTAKGREITAPLWETLFYGVLCFYLLDLGLLAGSKFGDVLRAGKTAVATALLFPPVNAGLGLALAWAMGLGKADAFLTMVMAASASYIAAPAALRIALPEARASVYVPMALTLTFPFNIVLGLPLYWMVVGRAYGRVGAAACGRAPVAACVGGSADRARREG
ncbi:MAG: sodium-dependent bicarbonate transport family permease [Phycisphaerales bacterium]|nr:sodium-dependent bicarbonate transport family permease [Phycisphaerales bacterium]